MTGFIFDNAQNYGEGLPAVCIDGKLGYIDTNQQMLNLCAGIPPWIC